MVFRGVVFGVENYGLFGVEGEVGDEVVGDDVECFVVVFVDVVVVVVIVLD